MSVAVAQWSNPVCQLQIGEVCLDLRYRRVSHPEGSVELPQRMFDLLLLFAAEPGVLHGRADLFDRVWSGVVVEDGNLSQSVWMLRKALGPARRHWIRTVAKSGYLFEPPHPVLSVPIDEAQEQTAAVSASIAARGAATTSPWQRTWNWAESLVARQRNGGRNARPVVAAAAASLALAVVVAASVNRDDALLPATGPLLAAAAGAVDDSAVVAAPPLPVMLVAVDDIGRPWIPVTDGESGVVDAEAVTSLMLGWLQWQLAMTPEVILVEPGLLAGLEDADPQLADPQLTVVLVASRRKPAEPHLAAIQTSNTDAWPALPEPSTSADQWRIRAWLRTPDGSHQVRSQGPADDMAGLIEEVAAGISAHLLPTASAPSLAGSLVPADAEGMAQYRQLLLASQARQWPTVTDIGARLVAQAPAFGLAHWHLALAHGELRQYAAAREHLRVAQALLVPTGAAAEQFRARQLAWSGEPAAAAAVYGRLSTQYPHQARFTLGQAQALQADGQAEAAGQVLAGFDRHRQPLRLQLRQQLLKADIALAMADPHAARAAARRAGQLSASAGWPLEAERARHLFAVADSQSLAAEMSDAAAANSGALPSAAALADRVALQALRLAADTGDVIGCPAPGTL
ncbi:MAG: winged helix-turn-helix domain-containing protein [Xanthomonadales bacterium]|nr:winged helix-turn-helix domain-containing protein [Xanthomonadales bacterium]